MFRLEELRVPIELRPLLSGDFVVPLIEGGPLDATVVIADDGSTDDTWDVDRKSVV